MIKIVDWSKYQSYKDRRPPWIRFHRTMLDNYEYQLMSADSRALLPMLWLLACEDEDPKSGLIQLEIKAISFRLRQPEKIINKCIDELQGADFIERIQSVTKPLRECNETVPPETETETETDSVFCFKSELIKLGANKDCVSDWLKVRKAKKSANTKTALKSIIREVGKSNLSFAEAIRVCAEKSWAGFNSEWVESKPANNSEFEGFNQ